MKRAPFLTFAVAAFLAFIVAPLVGIVVLELRAERARERREIEAAARLKLLAEQQRLREAGAWLASAPRTNQTHGPLSLSRMHPHVPNR